jgi:3-deoxy-D-manno-octulosonate 8-phosphate phosphatase (KDO 8-P phosphatase)
LAAEPVTLQQRKMQAARRGKSESNHINNNSMSLLNQFRKVKCFAFDVDGVLTDGSILLLDDGQMARSMNTRDGYALQLAVKKGFPVIIISGGGNEGVRERLYKLGITNVYINATDKKSVLRGFLQEKNIDPSAVLFMGDDIPDYEAMQLCGLPCCPSDAAAEIKIISKYIAGCTGGKGCVREVIEKVLKLGGHWHKDTSIASK